MTRDGSSGPPVLGEVVRNLVSRFKKLESLEATDYTADIAVLQADIAAVQAEIDTLQAPPVSTVQVAAMSIPNNALTKVTGLAVIANSDRGGMFASDRFTAVVAGIYDIGSWLYSSIAFGSYIEARIRLNGATDIAHSWTIPSGSFQTVAPAIQYPLIAGDYVELFVRQDSGSAANFNVRFWIKYVGTRP